MQSYAGLNDKEQLGGPKGSKIKLPATVDSMAALQPVSIVGGSKSLFIVTQSGKVFFQFLFSFHLFQSS